MSHVIRQKPGAVTEGTLRVLLHRGLICTLTVLALGSDSCSSRPEDPGVARAGARPESVSHAPQDDSTKGGSAYDQAPPEVILAAAAAACRNAGTYWISVATTVEVGDSVYKAHAVMASDLNDRHLLQVGGGRLVMSGRDLWQLRGAEYTHTRFEGDSDPRTAPEIAAALSRAQGSVRAVLDSLGRIDEGVKHLEWLGDEDIQRNGHRLRCARINVAYDEERPGIFSGRHIDYWIHRGDARILRAEEEGTFETDGLVWRVRETRDFLVMRLDEPLPDSLFDFSPPPGAKEVSEFSMPRIDVEEFRGRDVEDFALFDLNGQKHTLRALQGRVVVLIFWQVSSTESRRNLENLGQLLPELERRGIVVLAVHVGGSRAYVKTYVDGSGHRFPVLMDSQRSVWSRFANVVPTTLIITRNGTVGRYLIGEATLSELREAINTIVAE